MKYCFISNIGPHYRWAIYNLISSTFDMDFYFGKNETVYDNVKLFDYSKLKGFQKTLKNRSLYGPLWYQKGTLILLFKKYDTFILSGAPFCLSTWIFLIISKVLRKKTIGWTHGILHNHTGLKKLVFKTYFNLFDRVMTYNERSLNLLITEGVDKSKLFVIANSLNTDTHKLIREKLQETPIFIEHYGNDNPVVLYCGRIQKLKKLDLLLDALLILNERGYKINAVLVGGDSPETDIKEMVSTRKLNNQVWIYGPCYNEEILGNIFYNSAICVSPGNVGLTAIHSLSFGCPLITHDNFDKQMPEFEAIKAGVTGIFFRENDKLDLANKIESWLRKNGDNKEKIRQQAFQEIDSKWNIYYQVEVLKQVLASIK